MYTLKLPRVKAIAMAYGSQSFLTIAHPKMRRADGMYMPSTYFFDKKGFLTAGPADMLTEFRPVLLGCEFEEYRNSQEN